MPYLSSPGQDFGERGKTQREVGREDDERTNPLVGERWSTATLRVLSAMPSRTIGGSGRSDDTVAERVCLIFLAVPHDAFVGLPFKIRNNLSSFSKSFKSTCYSWLTHENVFFPVLTYSVVVKSFRF